jgi:transposase-like protein
MAAPRRLTPEQEARIVELYTSSDVEVGDIADQFEVSKTTVYDVLRRNNVPRTRLTSPYPQHLPSGMGLEQLPAEIWTKLAGDIVERLFEELTRLTNENTRLRAQLRREGTDTP